MRVLITGASGFVGRSVLAALLKSGIDVVSVGRHRPPIVGDYRFECRVRDSDQSLSTLFSDRIDAVVSLAWTVEHGRFWTAPDNLDWCAATLGSAKAAADHGVRRFVGVGTCYEYAWPEAAPCDEATTPLAPTTLYGITKDATRRVLDSYLGAAGIEFAWCRLFFLYGPGEGPDRLVPSLARALSRGEPARCSSGRVMRDFMDVRDAGDAIARVACSELKGAINIGSGVGCSIARIAGKLAELSGRRNSSGSAACPIARMSRLSSSQASIACAARLVSYRPSRWRMD